MTRRSFGILLAAASRAHGVELPPAAAKLLREAAAADSESKRLELLQTLKNQPGLSEPLSKDLDRMVAFVDRWVNENNLFDWWAEPIFKKGDYDFQLSEGSPLQPLAEIYRGRMLLSGLMEHSGLNRDEKIRKDYFNRAIASFEIAKAAFPENRRVRMYLGEAIPWPMKLEGGEGAPDWAPPLREHLERLTAIVSWWAGRQQPDGSFGGGWNDDVEMWRWQASILLAFDDPALTRMQQRLSQGVYAQPHMSQGYSSQMSDVEHSAEDSTDALVPMLAIAPGEPEWRRRAEQLAAIMRTRWTGLNQRGQRQFKAMWFNAEGPDANAEHAFDVIGNARAVAPLFVIWDRGGSQAVGELLTSWLDTWVEATAREENGKPAGAIPAGIHWPDGAVAGAGGQWWMPLQSERGMSQFYAWPSALVEMTDLFLIAWKQTRDDRYLEPVRSMAEIRGEFLENPPKSEPTPGTRAWCGAELGPVGQSQLSWTLARYRALTGRTDFDDILAKELPAVLGRDDKTLVAALNRSVTDLRRNLPAFTDEVRFTDRVGRWLAYEAALNDPDHRAPGPTLIDPGLIYGLVSGDSGSPRLPMPAVRWLTGPREIAVRVTESAPERFAAELFHFGKQPRELHAELTALAPGDYRAQLTPQGAEALDCAVTPNSGGFRVAIRLPARRLGRLLVERRS